jgi:hypothetical protein
MKVPRLLSVLVAVRELRRIRQALERQTTLLEQLAQTLAPRLPATDPATLQTDTGVDYVDPVQGGLVLDYIEKIRAATGHTPDEEEILIWLADERTQELQARLIERDLQVERLQASRRERYSSRPGE